MYGLRFVVCGPAGITDPAPAGNFVAWILVATWVLLGWMLLFVATVGSTSVLTTVVVIELNVKVVTIK